jgi:hypothetical protein
MHCLIWIKFFLKKAKNTRCEIIEQSKQNENNPDRRVTLKYFAGNMSSIETKL